VRASYSYSSFSISLDVGAFVESYVAERRVLGDRRRSYGGPKLSGRLSRRPVRRGRIDRACCGFHAGLDCAPYEAERS